MFRDPAICVRVNLNFVLKRIYYMYIRKYKLIIMFVKKCCCLLLPGKPEHDCATISLKSGRGKMYIACKEVKEYDSTTFQVRLSKAKQNTGLEVVIEHDSATFQVKSGKTKQNAEVVIPHDCATIYVQKNRAQERNPNLQQQHPKTKKIQPTALLNKNTHLQGLEPRTTWSLCLKVVLIPLSHHSYTRRVESEDNHNKTREKYTMSHGTSTTTPMCRNWYSPIT